MTATRFAKASTLVALAAGWLVAAWLSEPDDRAGQPARAARRRAARSSRRGVLHRAARYDGLLRWLWVASTLVTLAALVAVRAASAPRIAARLGARPRRDRRDGRRGDDARRLGGRAPVRRGAALVGPPLRARAAGLPRVGARTVAGAARPGGRPDDRADRPAAARRPLRPRAGGSSRRRSSSRSARCSCWCCRGSRRSARGRRTTRPLAARIRQLAREEGVGGTPVRIEDVHGETTAANAMATGIGPSARVFIWDTFLDGRYSAREIEVVAAHEFGHIAHHHIWKGLAWSLLLTVPGFWIVERATRRRGGLERPEVVPLCAARARADRPRRDAVRQRRLAPLRGRGRLVGAARDPRSDGGRERLPQVHPLRPGAAEPAALVVHLDRQPPDGGAADRDGPRLRGAQAAKSRCRAASRGGCGSPPATTTSTTSPASRRAARA